MQITLGTQYTMGILYRNTNTIPDYSRSSFFAFLKKNEEEAIPPGGKKKIGTCTEDVQYIYNIITVNGSIKVRGHVPTWRLM